MAAVAGGGDADYESDPDDALQPLAMRRREASDDEEGEDHSDGGRRGGRVDRRAGAASDGESDGQGGAADYEDEEYEQGEEEGEEDLLEEEEYVVYEDEVEEERGREGEGGHGDIITHGEFKTAEGLGEKQPGPEGGNVDNEGDVKEEDQEKKQSEPFAVPTAGAFYMHDDRFRDSRGGRPRRTPGGRKLWESRDDRAWVHDRFEEMNVQDNGHDEGRNNFRGRYRGRGKSPAMGRGYGRGNRSRAYGDNPRAPNDRSQAYDDRNRAYDDRNRPFVDKPRAYGDKAQTYNERNQPYIDKNIQNRAPRAVRGRGPRRYESLPKSNKEVHATRNKQLGNSHEPEADTAAVKQSIQASNKKNEFVVPQKQVFSSSLNYASPPYYPSGASSKDISIATRDAPPEAANMSVSSPILEHNFPLSHSTALSKGKTVVDNVSNERLNVDNSVRTVVGNNFSNLPMQSSGYSSSPVSASQSSQLRVQGRNVVTTEGKLQYQQNAALSQHGKASASLQPPAFQQRPSQVSVQPSQLGSTQQSGQRSGVGTSVSTSLVGISVSPSLQVQSTTASEVSESESPTGANIAKAVVPAKDRVGASGVGRAAYMYNGTQFIGANGAMRLAHGDQSFPATPALLPVMQFSGQHHGGLGVPAVGMALPGYVANPQLGFGNSEMAWLPMLAGAAGALGTSYGPYIALDGGFHPRPIGQASAAASKEAVVPKPANALKAPQGSGDQENDEFGQRQNKPRRYSEMNFGQ